jgi:hypothetical protein
LKANIYSLFSLYSTTIVYPFDKLIWFILRAASSKGSIDIPGKSMPLFTSIDYSEDYIASFPFSLSDEDYYYND